MDESHDIAQEPVTVRTLQQGDRDGWQSLWEAYNSFYRHVPADEVTEATFARLCAQSHGFFALVAIDSAQQPTGLAHSVLHPSTWTTASYCYLEDLYVDRRARGTSVGRALIESTYAEADARGAVRVYWHTQEYNAAARSLYDQVAQRTSFVVYRR